MLTSRTNLQNLILYKLESVPSHTQKDKVYHHFILFLKKKNNAMNKTQKSTKLNSI